MAQGAKDSVLVVIQITVSIHKLWKVNKRIFLFSIYLIYSIIDCLPKIKATPPIALIVYLSLILIKNSTL